MYVCTVYVCTKCLRGLTLLLHVASKYISVFVHTGSRTAKKNKNISKLIELTSSRAYWMLNSISSHCANWKTKFNCLQSNFIYCLFVSVTIPEKQPCRIDVSGVDQGTLSKEDIDNKTLTDLASKDLPIDCIWVITVKEGWKVSTPLLWLFPLITLHAYTPSFVYGKVNISPSYVMCA